LKTVLSLGYRGNHSVEDAAKTQVFMAASKSAREKKIRGEYWVPITGWQLGFGHWLKYYGSVKEELTALASDEGEQKKLWETCEKAVLRKATESLQSLAFDSEAS
jgi:hypothetical protein